MTAASRAPFAGRLETSGFLIDMAHVGPAEAYRRVAGAWVRGARLADAGTQLVLLLPAPVDVRAELAPGLPLVPTDGGWGIPRPGDGSPKLASDLPPADLRRVVDLDDFELVVLKAAPGIPEPPVVISRAQRPRPSTPFRSVAGVRAVDPAVARRAARLADEIEGRSPRLLPESLGRLAGRRPVTPRARRKHARYLDQLTSDFEGRNWDEALRSAISLGGRGGSPSMRLPSRRRGPLRPSVSAPGASRQVPYGETVHGHLRALYQAAAEQLESAGDHLRAAFVYADLLDNTTAAIDVLERNGHYAEAAELAEARGEDPAVAVRLWWRAGHRDRALSVASTRGAFAAAISRLEQSDADAAVGLRREWMHDRRRAGDHLGALAAAWPAEVLRDETFPDIAAGIAVGGPVAAAALAHWLEHAPTHEGVGSAREILTGGTDLDVSRRALVTALASHRVGDPTWDRELASSALAAIATGSAPLASRTLHDVVGRLQPRADPLLVADLPRLRPSRLDPAARRDLDLTGLGSLEVRDAVAVGTGSVLVALGEVGVRLLTLDGRVRARWDIPTHRLVLADHGNRVLLVTDRAPRFHVHQLDLPNGRPRPLPALDVMPLDTYDGQHPVLVSDRGIEWVAPQQDRWRLTWRELTEPRQRIHHLTRSPHSLAVVFSNDGLHAWQWELPSMALRKRGTLELEDVTAVVATGEVGRLHQQSGVAVPDWHAVYGHRLTTATLHPTGESHVMVSAESFAVVDRAPLATRFTLYPRRDGAELANLLLPPDVQPLLRSSGGRITAGHSGGRIVVIDLADNSLDADIMLRA